VVLGAVCFNDDGQYMFMVNWIQEHGTCDLSDGCDPVTWLLGYGVFENYWRDSQALVA
jgi:hypothetical protein